MTVITICGEPYSSNLGDGVIADCLRHMVEHAVPGAEVRLLDMSRKVAFEGPGAPASAVAIAKPRGRTRRLLPGFVRGAIREAEWMAKNSGPLRAHASGVLPGTDLLLIGGGHLLMDNGLRFPMKIRDVASSASGAGVRHVACFGVGVGERWSARGRAILRSAFRRAGVQRVITRDPESAASFTNAFPGYASGVETAADPALFSPEAYGISRAATRPPSDRPLIGLGPLNIRQTASNVAHADSGNLEATIRWWLALIDRLHADGLACEMFTNGDPTDQAVAEKVHEANIARGGPEVSIAERPMDPAGLVRAIARYDAIVAYRLHANIIAYSLKIPSVLLIWDRKVEHFARLTGRADFAAEGMNADAATLGGLVRRCIDEGVDESVWTRTRSVAQSRLNGLIGDLLGTKPNEQAG